MKNFEMKPEEVKLLLEFLQSATISNINGSAIWAVGTMMNKMAAFMQANTPQQDADDKPQAPSGY
jgi:hypothetical protein